MAREVSTLARFSLAHRRLRGLLLATGVASTFSSNCCSFLCRTMTSANCLAASARTLRSAGVPSSTSPRSTTLSSSIGALLQLFGQIHDHQLHQGGTADGLLHAQLAAFHAARQIDFAFARQQRNGAHFAQVHAYRIVGVDGLFHRRRVQEIGFMSGFRIEELGFFLEIEAQGFRVIR